MVLKEMLPKSDGSNAIKMNEIMDFESLARFV